MKTAMLKLTALALLAACAGPTVGGSSNESSDVSLFSPKPANLRILLTDAPNDNLTNVFVDVNRVELWLEKGSVQKRLVLPNTLGMIDLLTLQNGVKLALEDIDMPAGVSVKQIRLILNASGHSAVKVGGDVCELRTPSAQQSGIKILLPQPITFENNNSYSMVIDFDAKKSIVQMGNGECLLKPVLKLQSATKIPSDDINDDGSTTAPGDDLLDGETPGNDDGFNGGWDPDDPSTWPDEVNEDNIHNYL